MRSDVGLALAFDVIHLRDPGNHAELVQSAHRHPACLNIYSLHLKRCASNGPFQAERPASRSFWLHARCDFPVVRCQAGDRVNVRPEARGQSSQMSRADGRSLGVPARRHRMADVVGHKLHQERVSAGRLPSTKSCRIVLRRTGDDGEHVVDLKRHALRRGARQVGAGLEPKDSPQIRPRASAFQWGDPRPHGPGPRTRPGYRRRSAPGRAGSSTPFSPNVAAIQEGSTR